MKKGEAAKKIQQLSEALEEDSYRYHVLNQPTISDKEYDDLLKSLIKLEAEFKMPLRYGEFTCVTIRAKRLGTTSIDLEHAVWRDGLCASIVATCVIQDLQKTENLRIERFAETIRTLDGQ